MDISTEVAAIQAASQGSELRQPLVGALNKLNSGSLPAVTVSDVGKILKVGANGWEVGEKSGYMPVPTAAKQITENGTHDVTDYASAVVNVSGGGGVNILSGTDMPDSSIGVNGHIYLKYVESLPIGFTRLNYIQSTGNQYIDTGIIPTVNTSAKLKINIQSFVVSGILGCYWGFNGFFLATIDGSKLRWHCASNADLATSTNTDYEIELYNGGFNVNGSVVSNSTSTSIVSANLLLFRCPTDRYPGASCKIYSFVLYENGEPIRNFIPAKRDSDDAVGMYDTISDTFYTNLGSGTFISGDELANNAITHIYLKKNGSWQDLEGSSINDVNLGI